MQSSLSSLVDNLSGIENKELKDNMMTSLSQSINHKISQIDKKEPENKISQIVQIDKKELKNNKISQIDKKRTKK